jgi:hypothetical protein
MQIGPDKTHQHQLGKRMRQHGLPLHEAEFRPERLLQNDQQQRYENQEHHGAANTVENRE